MAANTSSSMLFRLPSGPIEFILLPCLSTKEEFALAKAIAPKAAAATISSTIPITSVDSSVSDSNQSTLVTYSILPPDRSNFGCLFNIQSIASRTWPRLLSTLHRTAEYESTLYKRLTKGNFANPNFHDSEAYLQAHQEAKQCSEEFKGIQILSPRSSNDEPHGLNYIHFISSCIRYYHHSELDPHYPPVMSSFDPTLLTQLHVGGLVLPSDTLKALQESAAKSTEQVHQSSHSSSSTSSSSSTLLLSTNLTDSFLVHLSLALSRLLPLTCAMRSVGCLFSFCHKPSGVGAEAAGYQLHPFIIRWPTNSIELAAAVKQYFPTRVNDQLLHEIQCIDTTPSSHSCCGGLSNPDAWLDDTALYEAMSGKLNEVGEYVPPDLAHRGSWTGDSSFTCPHECPNKHYLTDSSALVCGDHLTSVRGCLWSNCSRSMHFIILLGMRSVGVRDLYLQGVKNQFYRPGKRTDWSKLFQCPPFPHMNISDITLHPPPPSISNLLSSTLPWSIPVMVSGEADCEVAPGFECTPTPAMVMAPLAKGWVGGFIASATRQEG